MPPTAPEATSYRIGPRPLLAQSGQSKSHCVCPLLDQSGQQSVCCRMVCSLMTQSGPCPLLEKNQSLHWNHCITSQIAKHAVSPARESFDFASWLRTSLEARRVRMRLMWILKEKNRSSVDLEPTECWRLGQYSLVRAEVRSAAQAAGNKEDAEMWNAVAREITRRQQDARAAG